MLTVSLSAQFSIPARKWKPENQTLEISKLVDSLAQTGRMTDFGITAKKQPDVKETANTCKVCGWEHDAKFLRLKMDGHKPIVLRGVLPEILAVVHSAHERG